MTNTVAANKAEQQKRLRINEEKWTRTLMDAGWTALPSIILDKQHALGIDSLDLNILLQLAKHWWKRDGLPYPAKDTIAQVIGVDSSTIRKRIARMEREGLIQRLERYDKKGGQQSNHYSFDGLIKKMVPHAEEAIALKAKHRDETETFLKRKKATNAPSKLRLVTSGDEND